MYSTQAFLKGFQQGRDIAASSSGPSSGTRRVEILKALNQANRGVTPFELAVSLSDKPADVYNDVLILNKLALVSVEDSGADAVVQLTDSGRNYLQSIG